MEHYRTVKVPIQFHRPGGSTSQMRCFITYEEPFGVLAHAPTTDPHRWAVDEMEMRVEEFPRLFVKFQCVRCGETHHEEWLDEFPESFEFLPRTVLNFDGSPPVGAWEQNTGSGRVPGVVGDSPNAPSVTDQTRPDASTGTRPE